MKALSLLDERHQLTPKSFAEIRIWQVPEPVGGSKHDLKYSLAFVVSGVCVLRYDNEGGKRAHRHMSGVETPYAFMSPRELLTVFWNDVDQWRPE